MGATTPAVSPPDAAGGWELLLFLAVRRHRTSQTPSTIRISPPTAETAPAIMGAESEVEELPADEAELAAVVSCRAFGLVLEADGAGVGGLGEAVVVSESMGVGVVMEAEGAGVGLGAAVVVSEVRELER